MKKIILLAISAFLVANVSAQEQPAKECMHGPALTKEERVELDIKRLTEELYLSDKQADKFAETYREFAAKKDELTGKKECSRKEKKETLSDAEIEKAAKARFADMKKAVELQEKYYDKFRKFLNPRQVDRVLSTFGCGAGQKQCCGHHGHKGGEPKFMGGPKPSDGQRPQFDKRAPRPERPARP